MLQVKQDQAKVNINRIKQQSKQDQAMVQVKKDQTNMLINRMMSHNK